MPNLFLINPNLIENVFNDPSVLKQLIKTFTHELVHAKRALLSQDSGPKGKYDHMLMFNYKENRDYLDAAGINEGYSPEVSPDNSPAGFVSKRIDRAVDQYLNDPSEKKNNE